MMMVVFTLFFANVAKVATVENYPVFVFAGLLPWTFFATAITNAGNSVVGSERLITKIYFPRLAVPLEAVGAAVVDFLIAFGLLVVLMIYYRVPPGFGLLLAPLIFAVIPPRRHRSGHAARRPERGISGFSLCSPLPGANGMLATPSIYWQAGTGPGAKAPCRAALLAP